MNRNRKSAKLYFNINNTTTNDFLGVLNNRKRKYREKIQKHKNRLGGGK